jgi:transposase
MISLPDDLPDDPVLLKQLLLEALSRQEEVALAYQTHIVDLKEQIKLLRDRLFGRKSEQTVEPNTPQLALFNEPEIEPMLLVDDPDEKSFRRHRAVANAGRCRLICRVSKLFMNCLNTN